MFKISRLADRFDLSRSTLLYYDSIGLLKPSKRTEANYRLYDEKDIKRLELICMYRDMGIELSDIKVLLNDKTENMEILEHALINMEKSIEKIRSKQKKIMQVIQNNIGTPSSNVEIFLSVLKNLGFTQEDMRDFHMEYERNDEKGHHAFLQFLGMNESEIAKVKHHME